MKKTIYLTGLLVFISLIPLLPQTGMKEVREPEGGFSYLVPSDWSIGKIDGMQFQIVREKANKSFSTNVNFLRETNKYSFEEYYKINVAQMKEYTPEYKEIQSEEFVTAAGLKGKKLTCSNKQLGKILLQAYYFFQGKDKVKTIITCSALFEDKDKYLPVFDLIAKSFKTVK